MKSLFAFLLLLASWNLADACTEIKLTPKDGSVVHGRTAEFGVKLPLSAVVIPRNFDFTGTTPQGKGLIYKTKYAAVGIMAYDLPAIIDGMNEAGLSVGAFYFPRYAEYGTITPENQSKGLSPIEFSNWLVTQFASVDEIKEALAGVVIAPTVINGWGDAPPPFHYIAIDKTGKSIVIEPTGGKLVVFDNKLGVITNSPTFDWHLTNLVNYIHLTPFNVKPLQVEGMNFIPFGEGSGLIGLPGDFSPPSRFVRAAVFSITAIPSLNAQEAVFQAFHILNQFDIPIGAVRAKENGIVHTDQTLATAVRDPQALRYYFKTYEDQTIRMVDLKRFDPNGKRIRKTSVKSKQPVEDISSDLR
jgi:choloylglycine hydrolase